MHASHKPASGASGTDLFLDALPSSRPCPPACSPAAYSRNGQTPILGLHFPLRKGWAFEWFQVPGQGDTGLCLSVYVPLLWESGEWLLPLPVFL